MSKTIHTPSENLELKMQMEEQEAKAKREAEEQEAMKQLTGYLNEAAVKALKEKHKHIFYIQNDGHIGYFKKPGRTEINYISKKMADKGPGQSLDYFEELAGVLFIGGSEEMLKDEYLVLGVTTGIETVLNANQVRIKNL